MKIPIKVKSGPKKRSVEIHGFHAVTATVRCCRNKIKYYLDKEIHMKDYFYLKINPEKYHLKHIKYTLDDSKKKAVTKVKQYFGVDDQKKFKYMMKPERHLITTIKFVIEEWKPDKN